MTGNIYVSRPGFTYWTWQSDDVAISGLGIGTDELSNGAQPRPVNPPPSGAPQPNCNVATSLLPGLGLFTYAKHYNLMAWSGLAPGPNPPPGTEDAGTSTCVLLYFPLAGTYPFELDYEENVSPPYFLDLPIVPPGQLTLTKVINDASVAPFGTDTFQVQGPIGATNQIPAANGADTYTFTISCSTTNQPDTCTSSSYTLNNLVPGTYTVTEVSSAPGYNAAPGGVIPFNVVSGGDTQFTLGNNVIPASLRVEKLASDTQAPLYGATFLITGPSFPAGGVTVTTDTSGNIQCPVGGFPPSPEGPVYQPICSNGTISNLFPGTYTVTESGAPPAQNGSTYELPSPPPSQTVTLDPGDSQTLKFEDIPHPCGGAPCPTTPTTTTTTTTPTTSTTTTTTPTTSSTTSTTIVIPPPPCTDGSCGILIDKSCNDASNVDCGPVTFSIAFTPAPPPPPCTGSDCPPAPPPPPPSSVTVPYDPSCHCAQYSYSPAPAGTYTVTETNAPPHYDANPPIAQTQTLSGGTIIFSFFDCVHTGVLDITKTGNDVPFVPAGPATFSVTPVGVDGSPSGCGGISYTPTSPPARVTVTWDPGTNQATGSLPGLMPGTYTVTETTAPPGYVLSNPPQSVTVTVPPDSSVTADFSGSEQNCVLPGALNIIKQGDDVPFLQTGGATFTLALIGNSLPSLAPCGAETYTGMPDGPISVAWNANNLDAEATVSNLMPGLYSVTEDSPPAGYNLPPVTTQQIAVFPGPVNSVETLTFSDHYIPGSLLIQKQANDMGFLSSNGPEFAIYPGSDTTGPAITTVTANFDSACTVSNINGCWDITVPNLKPGDYTVVEMSSPPGYQNDSTPVPVTVNYSQTAIATFAQDTNCAYPGSITINKQVDYSPPGSADGAWFKIVGNTSGSCASFNYIPQASGEVTSGNEIFVPSVCPASTPSPCSDASVEVSDLLPGTYTVQEICPPPGYSFSPPWSGAWSSPPFTYANALQPNGQTGGTCSTDSSVPPNPPSADTVTVQPATPDNFDAQTNVVFAGGNVPPAPPSATCQPDQGQFVCNYPLPSTVVISKMAMNCDGIDNAVFTLYGPAVDPNKTPPSVQVALTPDECNSGGTQQFPVVPCPTTTSTTLPPPPKNCVEVQIKFPNLSTGTYRPCPPIC